MHHTHRHAAPALLLVLALAVAGSGCGAIDPNLIPPEQLPEHVKVVRLQLPSFDGGGLQGIWLWRRSEVSGQFEPASEIRLHGVVVEGGQEFVEYELMDPTGTSLGVTLSAHVDRNEPAPEVAFWVIRFDAPGEYRASVYNAVGESPMSAQSVQL